MAWKIDAGAFKGSFWQVVSRFTWELPQSFLGSQAGQYYNLFGGVKSVNYYGGATVVQGYSKWGKAFTLGSYIVGGRTLEAKLDNVLFQHEYGHYLQSQSMGWAYLGKVAIPSFVDASKVLGNSIHDYHPAEQDANIRAFKYFKKNVEGYDKEWKFSPNPILGYDERLPYDNESNQRALKNGKLGLSWYDWVMYPLNLSFAPIIPGVVNVFTLKNKY